MFDDVVVLTETEYEAYVIACLETEFDADYPDRGRLRHRRAAALPRLPGPAADLRRRPPRRGGRGGPGRRAAPRRRAPGRWPRSPAAARRRCSTAHPASGARRRRRRSRPVRRCSPRSASGPSTRRRPRSASPGAPPPSLLVDAVTLVEGLPATLAALSAGDISPAHARVMVELVGPVSTAAKRAEVEAAVLPRAGAADRAGPAGLRPAGGRPHRRRRGRRPAGQGRAGPAGAAGRPRRRDVRADRAVGDSAGARLLRGAGRLREGVRVRRGRQPRSADPRSSGCPTAWPTSSCARTPTTRRCGSRSP